MQSVPSPVTGGSTSLADTFETDVILERWSRSPLKVAQYYEGLKEVELRRCDATGYRFFYPPSLAGGSEFYDQFLDPDSEVDDPDYRTWCHDYQFALDRIIPGERVLDMGCGYGYFLDGAKEKGDVYGIDGNLHAQRKCTEKGLRVRHGRLQDYAEELAESFDLVCTFQVLEHVYEVGDFLSAAARVIKPGGRLIVAVPDNEPYFHGYNKYDTWNTPPHHIGLWNRASLEAAGRHVGLTPIEHGYLDPQKRLLVGAYMRARYWAGVKSDIHHHSLLDKIRIAAMAPIAVPAALLHKLKTGRVSAATIAMVFQKP